MWTREAENMLVKWAEVCHYKRALYEKAVAITASRDKWFGVPLTILGCITTSSMFLQANECDLRYSICVGILSLTYTILTSLKGVVGYQVDAGDYRHAKSEYNKIVLNIEEQLTRPPVDRAQCVDFVANIKAAILELEDVKLPMAIYRKHIADVDRHLTAIGIELHSESLVLSPTNRASVGEGGDTFYDKMERRRQLFDAAPRSQSEECHIGLQLDPITHLPRTLNPEGPVLTAM
jgi:hypothetical protein